MSFQVENSSITDLSAIAECHKRAFPQALSSHQGARFICKMLEWYVQSDRGYLIHVAENGRVLGYCGGIITEQPGLHGAASSITQYAFNAFVWSFLRKPWLLFHPETVKKYAHIFRNILYKTKLLKSSANIGALPGPFQPFMGLIVIGVDPAQQGKGIGSLLISAFEQEAKKRSLERVILSVKSTNLQAQNVYLKNGWYILETRGDSVVMEKKL